jgi:hypothetical protein
MLSVRPLRSTGITPLPRYYGPLRLPTRPPRRLCLPSVRWAFRPPCRVSQALKREAPRLLFPRALSPTTPEGPMAAFACCFATGLSGFILVGGLATFVFLSRPNRVHLRCGSRVRPCQASPDRFLHPALAGLHVRTGNLHGELLSVHKIKPGLSWRTDRKGAVAARAPTIRETQTRS